MVYYRLTKGTLSKIRTDIDGVKDLQSKGFVLDGTCREDGTLLSSAAIVLDDVPKADVPKADVPKADVPKGKRAKALKE